MFVFRVSFVSGGAITITGDGIINLQARLPNGIIAYSDYSGGGPAIQLSNGSAIGKYTLTGHVYVPRGLLTVGTGTPGFTMTGMLVGDVVMISMGPGQPWTFNAPTGGSGSAWRIYQ